MTINLNKIPHNPGCYIYKDSRGNILYIGKAKDLRKRVASYFNKKDHNPKTAILVSKIASVDTIITKNEIEALILESNLIKKNKPKYNIDLKDSRSYAFIEKTNDTFPRFKTFRSTQKEVLKKKEVYGPFTSGKAREDILEVINKTFKIRTCKNLPKRACLRYSIGICSAPCIQKISKEEYAQDVNSAKEVLKGKIDKVIKSIEKKMKEASKNKEYERAIRYREQIGSLEYLQEKQNMERKRQFNEDIINFTRKDGVVYLMIFNVYKGTLNNKQEFVFDYSEHFLEQFLKQYYETEKIPKEIIVPKRVDDALEEYLSLKKKEKVKITIPQKGEKKELLDLVAKNIELSFFGDVENITELKKVIKMQTLPNVIECFDISHLSGTIIVASMVQFRNGKSDKSNYRRYKMKTVTQNDDFASMREVVKRRYTKLKMNKESFPDLIVIDGGVGQLNAAIESLNNLGLRIPVISLAKEFEEIYLPNNPHPIRLAEKNKARLLLMRIRDEAHRFAVTYNKLLRKKALRGE